MKVTKAVIPAAGLGTRFLPATKAQPKEMMPIVDTPTIQYVVEEAVASGIRDILIITGKDKRAIEDHFDRSPELERRLQLGRKHDVLHDIRKISKLANIHYIRQAEQKGLGNAIRYAQDHVGKEPFVVLLGDTIIDADPPCTKQLIDVYHKYGGPVVALEQVPLALVDRYGIIRGDRIAPRTFRLTDLVEKPSPAAAPSRYAVSARYLLTPDVFRYLARTRPGKNGEIQLTDALRAQARDQAFYGCHFEGKRYDIGDRLGYVIAQVEFALMRSDMRRALEPYLRRVVRGLGRRKKG